MTTFLGGSMVERKRRWHIKWRDHCATCGVAFKRAQRWAYCSKKCEAGRRGFAPDDQPERAAEYLRLAVELESALDADREGIAERMAAARPKDAPVRDAASARPQVRDATMRPSATKFWLPALRKEWDLFTARRRTLAATVRFGRHLNEARAALRGTWFLRLFADHQVPVKGALPFAKTWAWRIMTVAANPVIACISHEKSLPRDLNSLYQLSRLAPDVLEHAIATGRVRRTMGRADVRELTDEGRHFS